MSISYDYDTAKRLPEVGNLPHSKMSIPIVRASLVLIPNSSGLPLQTLERLDPAVLAVTGDHSTPAGLKSHSWHPVPLLLVSSTCRRDGSTAFTETVCARGALGSMESKYLMGLLLGYALRLDKFCA